MTAAGGFLWSTIDLMLCSYKAFLRLNIYAFKSQAQDTAHRRQAESSLVCSCRPLQLTSALINLYVQNTQRHLLENVLVSCAARFDKCVGEAAQEQRLLPALIERC